MVVSHDRVFLDAVATDVLHLSGAARRLTQSHGNYGTWSTRREHQQKTFERASALRAEEVRRCSIHRLSFTYKQNEVGIDCILDFGLFT